MVSNTSAGRLRKSARKEPSKAAVDGRLPPAYRGRKGAAALVHGIPIRASVLSSADAFDLTRMVHDALTARGARVHAKAGLGTSAGHPGSWRHKAAVADLLWQVKRAWPLDALVLENRHTGSEGFSFHAQVAQAQTILLASAARDPDDGSLRPSKRRATDIAKTLPARSTLICGETHAATRDALRDACREREAFYVDAAPRADAGEAVPPGLEAVAVLDRFLRIRCGDRLTSAERVAHLARLRRRLHWSPSALQDVRWFDAGSRDPAQLRPLLDHLSVQDGVRLRLEAVLHFDADRRAEAARVVPFLRQAFADGLLVHAHVTGAGSQPIMRELGASLPLTLHGSSAASAQKVLALVGRDCRGGAVVTAGDPGAPWMRELASGLRLPGVARGEWAPYHSEPADLPALAGPMPAAAAPALGRRPSDPSPAEQAARAARPRVERPAVGRLLERLMPVTPASQRG